MRGPYCRLESSGSISLPQNAVHRYGEDSGTYTEADDPDSLHSATVGARHRITLGLAGLWFIGTYIVWSALNNGTMGYVQHQIRRNADDDTDRLLEFRTPALQNRIQYFNHGVLAQALDADDHVHLTVFHSAAAARSIASVEFWAAWVGP